MAVAEDRRDAEAGDQEAVVQGHPGAHRQLLHVGEVRAAREGKLPGLGKIIAFNIRALASAFLSRDSNVGVLGICLVFADTLPRLAIAPNFCLLGK